MFGKKSLSFLLYWIAIIGFLATTGLYCFSLGTNLKDHYLTVREFVGSLFIYVPASLFFYFLIRIFKLFILKKLFYSKTVKYLNYFAILNFLTPVTFLIYLYISIGTLDFDILPHVRHTYSNIFIGIFVLFLGAILKQGYNIQEENDLTI